MTLPEIIILAIVGGQVAINIGLLITRWKQFNRLHYFENTRAALGFWLQQAPTVNALVGIVFPFGWVGLLWWAGLWH